MGRYLASLQFQRLGIEQNADLDNNPRVVILVFSLLTSTAHEINDQV